MHEKLDSIQENPDTMQGLLSSDDQTLMAANGALSRLWRVTLRQLGMSSLRWERLLTAYWDEDTRRQGRRDKSMKGNLVKGLVVADMTWRIFCRGLTVLGCKNASITIRITEGDKTTELPINIGPTYREQTGATLAWAWGEILNQWPDRKKDWKKYLAAYADQAAEQRRLEESIDFRSSMARTLGSNNLMWNMFFKGLCALDVDLIELELRLEHRRRDKVEIIPLKLINNNKS